MENSTPCKYKTVKDIEKPFRVYHYVGESSYCAKIYRNRITHFRWATRGSFSFFTYKHTHTHTHRQTNNFFHLAYRLQIWTELNALTLIIRGFRCRCAFWGSRRRPIIFRGPDPQKPKFWGVNRHFKPILQKIQIPISSIDNEKTKTRWTVCGVVKVGSGQSCGCLWFVEDLWWEGFVEQACRVWNGRKRK